MASRGPRSTKAAEVILRSISNDFPSSTRILEKVSETHLHSKEWIGAYTQDAEGNDVPTDGSMHSVDEDDSTTTKETYTTAGPTTLTYRRDDAYSEITDSKDKEASQFSDGYGVAWDSGWRTRNVTITRSRQADIEETIAAAGTTITKFSDIADNKTETRSLFQGQVLVEIAPGQAELRDRTVALASLDRTVIAKTLSAGQIRIETTVTTDGSRLVDPAGYRADDPDDADVPESNAPGVVVTVVFDSDLAAYAIATLHAADVSIAAL